MSQTPNYIVCPKLPGKYQKPITNLIGKTYGFLEVVEIKKTEEVTQTRWICRCICGKEKSILGTHLGRGLINSCGCKKGEMLSKAKLIDLRGKVFGRWKVVGDTHIRNVTATGRQTIWECQCECGEVGKIYAGHLVSGKSRSCGCLAIEITKITNRTHGATAGGSREPEFSIWAGIHNRCTGNGCYVKKGRKVCQGWSDYVNFRSDMGRRPSPELTVERINNKGHYSCGRCQECIENEWPMNCCWDTWQVQANNKENNVQITHNGVTMTAAQWDRHLGRRVGISGDRHRKGWTVERNLTQSVRVK